MAPRTSELDINADYPQVTLHHPKVLLLSACATTAALCSYKFYLRYVKRISSYLDLTPQVLRTRRKLHGKVTRVGDGDNFHFYHTPGGVFLGWGWMRSVPPKSGLKGETLQIRLCGVDAPERAHFGKTAQPFSEEALKWLQNYILGKTVSITPYSIDQYKRVVARTLVWKLTGPKDVSAEMLRQGMAVVFESKTGAEFGNNEQHYRKLERKAKLRGRGLWSLGSKLVTPGEFKKLNK